MNTYLAVMEALLALREAHDREITRWFRIRRKAIEHGCTEIPRQILDEIYKAQRDSSCDDFRNFTYQYKFLFQLDNPWREPEYHTRVSEIDW